MTYRPRPGSHLPGPTPLSTTERGSKLPTHYPSRYPCHQPGTVDLCPTFAKLEVKFRVTGCYHSSPLLTLSPFFPNSSHSLKPRVASNGLTQLSMPHLWRQTKAWRVKMACQWAVAVYMVNWTVDPITFHTPPLVCSF